jgi:hypothetical protein
MQFCNFDMIIAFVMKKYRRGLAMLNPYTIDDLTSDAPYLLTYLVNIP